MPQFTADEIISRLENLRGVPVTDEERYEVEQWEKGRVLAPLVMHPGWDTAIGILRGQAERAVVDLLNTTPTDVDAVRAAHAVAYATNSTFQSFLILIDSAIQASKSTPRVIQDGYRSATPVPYDQI